MDFRDYYKTLGVDRGAAAAEVKAAFRKLARQCHPDVRPDDRSAERRFKEINEAYEVLGDPESRRKYDALGANWKQYERAAAAGRDPFPGGRGFASGATRGRRRHRLDEEEFGDRSGAVPLSEFFQTFFGGAPPAGGRRPGARRAPAGRGPSVEQPLELTLEEAFAGVTRRVAPVAGDRSRTVEVRIPPGVADGTRIRVAGRGASGPSGAGDLMLRVRIARHATFVRRGDDLSMRCPMPLTTAVLGGEVLIAAIDGDVRLKVPPGTQQGQTFRVRGRGMPSRPPGGHRGDLYATAHVELPRHLSPEARRHFEALAALGQSEPSGSRPSRVEPSTAREVP